MPKEIQANQNDLARARDVQQNIAQQSGGLSESAIATPEQARKSALMQKIREQGY